MKLLSDQCQDSIKSPKNINKGWKDDEKKKTENSPICSTMSGGKTLEAKARRKISENSLSRPPMPIFSKFQSGLMMDWRGPRVLAFPGGQTKSKDVLLSISMYAYVYCNCFILGL